MGSCKRDVTPTKGSHASNEDFASKCIEFAGLLIEAWQMVFPIFE
jgi:hypothetical protein